MALRRPASVFSGARAAAPRWPITVASPGSALATPARQGRQPSSRIAPSAATVTPGAGALFTRAADPARAARSMGTERRMASPAGSAGGEVLAGVVDRVLFERPETGYRVLQVSAAGERMPVVVVGVLPAGRARAS